MTEPSHRYTIRPGCLYKKKLYGDHQLVQVSAGSNSKASEEELIKEGLLIGATETCSSFQREITSSNPDDATPELSVLSGWEG